MSLETWLAFAAASLLVLAVPGPTVLLVAGTALARGRRAGLAMVPGVIAGDAVAMTVSLAGLGAVLAASAGLFTALKLVGAAYLVWLGIRMWRAPAPAPREAPAPRAITAHAFVVTALNPKSIAFFVAFVPLFLDADAPLLPQLLAMEATFVALAGLNAAAWALAAGGARRIATRPAAVRAFNRLGGGALVGAGVWTAAASRS